MGLALQSVLDRQLAPDLRLGRGQKLVLDLQSGLDPKSVLDLQLVLGLQLGLVLDRQTECIGRLSDLNARPGRGTLGMAITPYVFRLDRDVQFTPNYEVAEVLWVPLDFLMDAGNREQMVWKHKGVEIAMPCYMYQGRRIWGLSLMMLDELLALLPGGVPDAGRGIRPAR